MLLALGQVNASASTSRQPPANSGFDPVSSGCFCVNRQKQAAQCTAAQQKQKSHPVNHHAPRPRPPLQLQPVQGLVQVWQVAWGAPHTVKRRPEAEALC